MQHDVDFSAAFLKYPSLCNNSIPVLFGDAQKYVISD